MTCLSKFRLAQIKGRCDCCNKPIYDRQNLVGRIVSGNEMLYCMDCMRLYKGHKKSRGGLRRGSCINMGESRYAEIEEQLSEVSGAYGY